jgi:YVTN family beta-propeller protein
VSKKLLLLLLSACALLTIAAETRLFPILSSTARIGKQAAEPAFFLLPTNQLLRPWGEQTLFRGRPVDLAFDSRKSLIAVLNTRAVHLLDATSGAELAQIPARSTSYTGVAFRPGDREIWASETRRDGPDSLLIAKIGETGKVEGSDRIELPGHPLPCGIAFSAAGDLAYVAFSRNNSLAVIDAKERKVVREIPTGIAPFGVVAGDKIYVTNRGGRVPAPGDVTGPTSGGTVVTNAVTGSTSTGTLSIVDPKTGDAKQIEVGLAPSSLILSPDAATLAVTNSHSDSVSLIDTKTLKRTDVKIPAYPEGTLGSVPNGAAFAPDGQRLYVSCGGNNAVAVLEHGGKAWTVAGAIPTGWFPSGILVDDKGALRVLNIKGNGNTARPNGNYNSRAYEGSLLRIPAPLPPQIAAGTRETIASNSPKFEDPGGIPDLTRLGIQHVFFIIKENRTYDQVFGDLPKGNNDPSLTLYGRDITPNQHALAEKYVTLDNFHTGGAISFDGHQWLMQAFVSDYVERAFAASPRGYAWNMSDAMTVSPAGMFWQSAVKPLDVRIYGEFTEPARWDPAKQQAIDIDEKSELPWSEYWKAYKEGTWQNIVGSRSGVPALQKFIDPKFPHATTMIPDQIRAEELIRELHEFEKNGKLPNLSIVTLETDHTNGTRPGSPTPRAMVAEDDLALGRIVEAISKSRYWAASLILVVEDDAQDGIDHVDGHRTVALAIGPRVRRGAVDSTHYNHSSMVRTIQEIFDIPAKTRFLLSARAMHSVFTAEADLSAYSALQPKQALDEMNKPLRALAGRELWAAKQSAAMNWSEPDDIPSDVLNRILWWDSKGYNTAYPHESTKLPDGIRR